MDKWYICFLTVCFINFILFALDIVIASKVDKLEREYKKYKWFWEDNYQRYMKEDYEARHRYKDAKKYAPGCPEDRL